MIDSLYLTWKWIPIENGGLAGTLFWKWKKSKFANNNHYFSNLHRTCALQFVTLSVEWVWPMHQTSNDFISLRFCCRIFLKPSAIVINQYQRAQFLRSKFSFSNLFNTIFDKLNVKVAMWFELLIEWYVSLRAIPNGYNFDKLAQNGKEQIWLSQATNHFWFHRYQEG